MEVLPVMTMTLQSPGLEKQNNIFLTQLYTYNKSNTQVL